MVFKSIHLARQSFSKALGHGYAQSVVAATQSSYASSSTPYTRAKKSGRPQTAQLHTAFQNASNQPSAPIKPARGSAEEVEPRNGDPNLQGYYEALWKRQQTGEDKKWGQYQFPKTIGWKGPSVIGDGKQKARVEAPIAQEASFDRQGLDRAYSTSALDDIKRTEDEVAEVAALAKVDEAIAQVITELKNPPTSTSVSPQRTAGVSADNVFDNAFDQSKRSTASPTTSITDSASPKSLDTATTSVQDGESQAFSDHIRQLREQSAYVDIPHTFRLMVSKGLQPTIGDYNALLAAAVHLPMARHQSAPKVLDIYSDLMRRKVAPDTAFYSTLIEVLSDRALDVVHWGKVLETRRIRFGGVKKRGGFLLASNEAEYEILAQDDAILNAIKIFQISMSSGQSRHYSAQVYQKLITACALNGKVDEMIAVYTHMESHMVKPVGAMFPPMIEAFSKSGDLSSGVDCFNEYKAMAIKDDAGKFAIVERKDNDVYAAVIKAYMLCGKVEGGQRFFAKVLDSYSNVSENRKQKLEAVQDTVVSHALVEHHLSIADYTGALRTAKEQSLTLSARNHAMARICAAAADYDNVDVATKAFENLDLSFEDASVAIASMLALQTRLGNLKAAHEMWALMSNRNEITLEATASFAIGLIRAGQFDEGLMLARQGFARIRSGAPDASSKIEVTEEIDEAFELLGTHIRDSDVLPSAHASMTLLWAMVENGGLVPPVAEQMLTNLGPQDIDNLSWHDMILALQVEAGLVSNANSSAKVTHPARFAHLFDIAIRSGGFLDERTTGLIEKVLGIFAIERPDLANQWQLYQQRLSVDHARAQPGASPHVSVALPSTTPVTDSYDPYAATTDYKGSTVIGEELDNRRNSAGLNEALLRFRNIRRAGRHPRYVIYAKLISAAAKEGRTNLIHDILGMARNDLPFLPQYTVVRHGWSTILDAMVGACLTVGRRSIAEQYHQEMLDMGVTPTANTFGLYITTLKDSTKTFDEASEAVAIYSRAVSEGVVPSSFLYNALIGKLGKARRIDDCLRYFQEMRAAGIRPTSVTYGTVVNALCRVSDDRFAEELFDEMESMPNYKPRPAPYNSLMQYFLTTKRDSQKVLSYYNRMQSKNIEPTMHTYKLLIDTYATLEPVNLAAAEGVLDTIRASGQRPEAVHYASLIHAKGCALHDMEGSRRIFNEVLAKGDIRPQACLYQALFESMVANHCVAQTEGDLQQMSNNGIEMTPYIANTLIHGWAMDNNIAKSKAIYDSVSKEKREPSTYEAMTRAFLTGENREGALATVHEMLSRGYPSAVSSKILELVGHGTARA